MQNVETEDVIQKLIEANVPFVIFREPGADAMLLIQHSPLDRNGTIKIKRRGFYAFPFSTRESVAPLFFAPDELANYTDRYNLIKKIQKLAAPELPQQDLYEVRESEYVEDLAKYLSAFKSKDIKKAIYSRISTNSLEAVLNVEAFFEKLEERYKKAFVYAMHIPGDGIWMGASPELLLSYEGGKAKTVALAGTLKIDNNLSAPDWTRKEIDEHRLVEKHIVALCDDMGFSYEKSVVRTSNTGKVYHLKSDFTLEVPTERIVEFLEKLHPTPAISGLPQDASLKLIYEVEKHDRSYYCGFLGFVNDIEEFNLFINLRCMKVSGSNYSLFAGGGITAESNIDKEWEETKVKMATLLDLISEQSDSLDSSLQVDHASN